MSPGWASTIRLGLELIQVAYFDNLHMDKNPENENLRATSPKSQL